MRLLIALLFCLYWFSASAQTNDVCAGIIDHVDIAPDTVDGQRPTQGWQPVTLPDLWKHKSPEFSGAAWYKITWTTPCPEKNMALNINQTVMTAQIFINDIPLSENAPQTKLMQRHWNTPYYMILPASTLKTHNTLWIKVSAPAHIPIGLGRVRLGSPEKIEQRYLHQQLVQQQIYLISIIICMTVGGLFGIFWLLHRKEHAFGWFALASFFWGIWLSNLLVTSPWPFNSNAGWDRLNLITFAAYCSTFCLFTWSFGGMHFPRMRRVLWWILALVILTILCLPSAQMNIWFSQLFFSVTSIYILFLHLNWIHFIVHACRTRQPSHLQLAVCLFICLMLSLSSISANLNGDSTGESYAAISAPLVSICMFLILAWRYASNLRRIESFNAELQTVIIQTKEELTLTLKNESLLAADNARLQERLRMTHDLHDSLGSSLMHSMVIVGNSTTLGGKQFLSILKELRNDLRHVIDGTSSSIAINPDTPAEWIAPLRRRFTGLLEEMEISISWHLPPVWPEPFSSTQLLCITRFVEEALTNAIKHSHATHLEVSMLFIPDVHQLSLSVTDNGTGFDVSRTLASEAGIGMHSMIRRIERINGKLDITSLPGKTILTARISPE